MACLPAFAKPSQAELEEHRLFDRPTDRLPIRSSFSWVSGGGRRETDAAKMKSGFRNASEISIAKGFPAFVKPMCTILSLLLFGPKPLLLVLLPSLSSLMVSETIKIDL